MLSPEGHAAVSSQIVLEDVSVAIDGQRILSDVSLDVSASRIAVIGSNGSGKSTFARLLNALVTPTRGRILVHGVDAVAAPSAARRQAGFIFSSPDAQILMPTVAEDVALSLKGRVLGKADAAERVQQALRDYGLDQHADSTAYTLSGGEKQLLALASVLVTQPALVIADEPTTLLDRVNARRIGDILIEELPMQAVIVTHNLALARRCEAAILFEGGRVRAVDEASAVVDGYERLYA